MLSPRGSHALRPISADLRCEPAAELEWTQDVFGNLIATASFPNPTDRLVITNRVTVEQTAAAWPILKIAPHAHRYPFDCSLEEWTDLGALLVLEHPDSDGRLGECARAGAWRRYRHAVTAAGRERCRANGMTYVTREEAGTQSPQLTLDRGSGSCRDLATLFIEAVRHLGLAARAVSASFFDPPISDDPAEQRNQHGATHAWAEVFLPCAGWVAFDPTNGRMGEAHLVPVAVGRSIGQLSPVDGRYIGAADAFLGMTVEVTVSAAGQNLELSPKDGPWNLD